MSKKLWTFGDSFTAFYDINQGWANQYANWKGYIPKVYGQIIAEKLGYELINLGRAQSDNYRILETICTNSIAIKENDLIIIGWSSPVRFRLVTESKYDNQEMWQSILPSVKENNSALTFNNTISENTLNEILYNRKSFKYIQEVINWTKLINKGFINNKNKVIHWSPFGDFQSSMFSEDIKVIKCDTIDNETNGAILDKHFSEIGQVELANELIKIISTENTNQKNNLI